MRIEVAADDGTRVLLDLGMPLVAPDGGDFPRGTSQRPTEELIAEGVLVDVPGVFRTTPLECLFGLAWNTQARDATRLVLPTALGASFWFDLAPLAFEACRHASASGQVSRGLSDRATAGGAGGAVGRTGLDGRVPRQVRAAARAAEGGMRWTTARASLPDYLTADSSFFVNPEFCIRLSPDGPLNKGEHWYCGILVVSAAETRSSTGSTTV